MIVTCNQVGYFEHKFGHPGCRWTNICSVYRDRSILKCVKAPSVSFLSAQWSPTLQHLDGGR